MLKKHVSEKITKLLGFTPTSQQSVLIEKLTEFILNIGQLELFVIKGYAGTGKTTVLAAMVKAFDEFKIKSFLMAPTGRAAKVVSSYSGKNAYTIHKKIYRQKSSKDGFGTFQLDKNLHSQTIFFVDEASMIGDQTYENTVFGSGSLLNDLVEYTLSGKNCKLILIGDEAQLPPVGLDVSPALNIQRLEQFGFICHEYTLTEVVRQEKSSGILVNATQIREQILSADFIKKIEAKIYPDVEYLFGEDMIDKISNNYDQYGIDECIVICRSNKRANKFNQGIRTTILYREEELVTGDLLMIVKNNYYWFKDQEEVEFIANGEIAEVVRIKKYSDMFDYRFADVTLRLKEHNNIEIDTRIILDSLSIEAPSMPSDENRAFFYKVAEDYQEVKPKAKMYQSVKEDPWFNALQVKYSYAITCHKAQGGQWKSVFIDHGYITDEMVNSDFFRWLYTAFTRATEKVYLVNFSEKLVDKPERD